jgi:predicted DsbA family dithiol-disulfide isomerase
MSDSSKRPLRIDIVSDVVCPWCIIGYKQLQQALQLAPRDYEIDLHWQPFELNPQMPAEGQNLREHLAQKYGATAEQSRGARERLTALGDSLGFHFDYSDGMRMVNTFRAHQLLHWAAGQGRQTELKLALFEGFFTHGRDVNDIDTLVDIAAGSGLDREQAMTVLAEHTYAAIVREQQAVWLDRDVHAVPAFFFDEKYMVPGAQSPEVLLRVLDKIEARRLQATDPG